MVKLIRLAALRVPRDNVLVRHLSPSVACFVLTFVANFFEILSYTCVYSRLGYKNKRGKNPLRISLGRIEMSLQNSPKNE